MLDKEDFNWHLNEVDQLPIDEDIGERFGKLYTEWVSDETYRDIFSLFGLKIGE
jgi:hypothetical protein